MNSLTDYIHNEINNKYVITESQLYNDHLNNLGSILYKTRVYAAGLSSNNIFESNNNVKVTLDESESIKYFFTYIAEEYKKSLYNELSIYEGLINGTISIDNIPVYEGMEGITNFVDGVKSIYKAGKDKVQNAYNTLKTNISEVNEFIKSLLNQTFNNIKDILLKALNLLDKLKTSASALLEKLGCGKEQQKSMLDEFLPEMVKNDTEKLKDINIYEGEKVALAFNPFKNSKNSAYAKKNPVWAICLQIFCWLFWCMFIPAIAYAAAPVGIIAPTIYVIIKLLFSIKGFIQVYRQQKEWFRDHNSWDKKTRNIKLICLILGYGGLIINVFGLGNFFTSGAGGKLISAIGDGSFGKDVIIKPDWLTTQLSNGFRKLVGKESVEEYWKYAEECMKKAVNAGSEAVTAASSGIKQTGLTDKEAMDMFKNGNWKNSTSPLKEIIDSNKLSPEQINKLGDNDLITVVVDGSSKSGRAAKLFSKLQELGISKNEIINKATNGFNKGLNDISTNAGSMYSLNLPAIIWKKLINSNIDLSQFTPKGHGFIGAVGAAVQSTGEAAGNAMSNIDPAIISMSPYFITAPYAEYATSAGKGFRVRLGDKKSNNYIYEIIDTNDNGDGIRTGTLKDLNLSESGKKQFDMLIDPIIKSENQKLKELENQKDISEEGKKACDDLKKHIDDIKNNISIILFNGKRVEDNSNESKVSSLHDYIINERMAELKENDKQNNKEINDIIDKLFNDDKKDITDKDKEKIIEYINKEFDTESDQLDDDDIQDIISKISELLNNLKNEESSERESENTEENKDNKDEKSNSDKVEAENKEDNQTDTEEKSEVKKESLTDYIKYNLITEGVTVNNIYNSIIDDILDFFQKELEKNKKEKNSDKKYIQTISDKLDKIFNADKLGATTDSEHLGDIDSVVEYFVNLSKGNISDFCKEISIKDFCKLFTYINSLYKYCKDNQDKLKDRQYTKNDKNLSKENNNDISDEAKLFYKKIVNILSKTKEFENYLRDYNKKTLNIKVNDDVKEPSDEEWMKAGGVNPDYIKIKSKETSNKEASEETSSEETSKETNSLLSIYKKIISLFGKSDKVKKDIKDNVLKLIDDEDTKKDIYKELNIESNANESLVNEAEEEGSSLLQKLKNAMSDLKNYLLKKKDSDNNDDKSSEDSSNDNDNNSDSGNNTNGAIGKEPGEAGPVLMFAAGLGVDLAYADENGPRKLVYAIKGCTSNKKFISFGQSKGAPLEFILIEHGENVDSIEDKLADYLHKQSIELYQYIAEKPCTPDEKYKEELQELINSKKLASEDIIDKINKWKWIPRSMPSGPREDYGHLTNDEVTIIFNNPKNSKKIKNIVGCVDAIFSKKEKETINKSAEKYKNDILQKVKDNDEETIKKLKEENPNSFDSDNKPNKDVIADISNTWFRQKLGHKAENNKKKKGGFLGRLLKKIGRVFGLTESSDYNDNEFDYIIENMIQDIKSQKVISLTDYLKENLN